MLTLIQRVPGLSPNAASLTLSLTAEERTKSRHRFTTDDGQDVHLNLPRGTVLRGGDVLVTPEGVYVQVRAKPEPVITVTAHTPFDLLRAAYHLGNRHVPLEVAPTYLRFSPDAVLEAMVQQLGLVVTQDEAAFEPESGAYGSPSAHTHTHDNHHH